MVADGAIPAGWYEDPMNRSEAVRYWDGSGWTHHTSARPAPTYTSSMERVTSNQQKRPEAPPQRNLQPCPDCGTELSPLATACVRCGRPLTTYGVAATNPTWSPQQTADDKSGRYALEYAIWIIVFIIGLAISFVFPLALIVVLIAGVGFVGALIRSIAARSKSRNQYDQQNLFGP